MMWLSVFNNAKRQCMVASSMVHGVPGLAAGGALRRQGRYKTRRAKGLARASGEESRQAVEAKELERWRKELASLIVDAALPVVEPMALVRDRDAVLVGALGPARASTIRKHVREWRKARAFCVSVSGKPWPEHIGVILDYLHERRLEPCARTAPAAFLAALSSIEKVGAVRCAERLSEDPLLRNTVNQLTADLESRAPPKRQAPMLPLSIIGATELAVSDTSLPTYTRGFAFYKLLKLWTASRTNDLFGLNPDSLRLSEFGLQGTLDRTKCSGPGKRIRFLPIFISRRVFIMNPDWLVDGWAIWQQESMGFQRDYFLPLPRADHSGARHGGLEDLPEFLSARGVRQCVAASQKDLLQLPRKWHQGPLPPTPEAELPDLRPAVSAVPEQDCDCLDAPYFIAIVGKKRLRRLHRRGGCGTDPADLHEVEWVENLQGAVYDYSCKHCWRKEVGPPDIHVCNETSSSSESSSSDSSSSS